MKTMLDIDQMDQFLDDAAHLLRDAWQKAGGRELSPDSLYALNDMLAGFFLSRNP